MDVKIIDEKQSGSLISVTYEEDQRQVDTMIQRNP